MYMILAKKTYIAPIVEKVLIDDKDDLLDAQLTYGSGASTTEALSKDGTGISLESKSSSFSSEIWDSEN